MLNFKHLHYFVSVAREGGIIRAAERLHLAPQTLSVQISQLEERIGVMLFDRTGRRMELTPYGKAGVVLRRGNLPDRCGARGYPAPWR